MSHWPHIERFDALTKNLDEARAILASLQANDHGKRLSWDVLAPMLSGTESLIEQAIGEADIWLDQARSEDMKARSAEGQPPSET